jgi:threonine/homoserine/homoserine lactone efflux protein
VGATFFMLIETSMTRGFRSALWFDLGVLFCDALLIAAIYFFAAWINRLLVHSNYFNLAGGVAFVGFGINYILARRKEDMICKTNTGSLKLILNGFFINLLNPSVFVFWLGSMAFVITQFKLTGKQVLVYFGVTLSVVTILDVIKAYFAYRLSRLLSPRVLRSVYLVSGILMIGFGVYILLK